MKYDTPKTYNKLVRDKIPDIIRAKGKDLKMHIAGDEEYWQKLLEKFKEELQEFVEAGTEKEMKEEMADIFEVITAVDEFKGWKIDEIIEIQKKKRDERGAFKEKIILEES